MGTATTPATTRFSWWPMFSKSAVRSFELVARQGGDEFSVLLPNTGSADALLLAERLRGEIAAQSVRGEWLSASIGLAFA